MMFEKTLKKIYLFFYKKRLKNKYNLKFGGNVYFNKSTKFQGYNYLSNNVSLISSYIGFASYLGENSKITSTKIGKYTSIGPNVKCVFGNHPSNTFVSTHPAFFSLRKQVGFTFVNKQIFNEFQEPIEKNKPYTIAIGNDVWIGAEVTILDGVKIGDGAIIAAGSLVNKDIAPYTVVGGVPAKPIKKRFNDEEINFLINFKWWDQEMDWLKINAPLFININGFLKNFSND